jgi:prepilin-type N-terminal cleavage/methylation domain-containing protein
MKSLSRHKNGFSLVEILIVIAMLGVIMGAVYSLFITNQRTAYTSDETVEVQQNLRIAMDTITKDLRMAGLLVDTSVITPLSAPQNNVGVKVYGSNSPAPNTNNACLNCDANPVATGSDAVTINMISASGIYARVAADATGVPTLSLVPAVGAQQASDGELFAAGDLVSIIRPFDASRISTNNYTVKASANNSITFTANIAEEVRLGDVVAKVNNIDVPLRGSGNTPNPNTVLYSVVNNGVAGCPFNQFCLARTANGDAPVVVAQNIADFQLRYILDDNSVTDAPADLALVKAVIVTIWGETATTRMLSANTPKIRQLTSVVKLRNRR